MKCLKNADYIDHLMTIHGNFLIPQDEVTKTENGFEYKNETLAVKSVFCEHKSGVISRKDVITNVSDKPITLTKAMSKFTLNGGETEVYTQFTEWCEESQGCWQNLETEISARNDEFRSNSNASPFFAVYNEQNQRGLAFHIMADGAWSYKVRKYFLAKNGYKRRCDVELGLCCDNFLYELKSGESLELPEILYYEFKNKVDLDAFKLHRYANERFPARSFPIIYNTWMSKFDDFTYESLCEQLEKAQQIGCEYFVIDAGWFGPPHSWGGSVGDWEEYKDGSLKGRMKEFSDEVRKAGLKFGLWFEIERAYQVSNAVTTHPEHYIPNGPNFMVNFASPAACDFVYEKLANQIRRCNVEFIKFDFNCAYDTCNLTDSAIAYFKGYRAFIERLNKEFPQVYLENCAGGGTRQNLSNIKGFDSFWMTDNHNMFRQLDIFRNCVKRMPPRMLEKWITIRSLENFTPVIGKSEPGEKILMSSDGVWTDLVSISKDYLFNACVGGPIGISCDLTQLSEKVLGDLKEFFKEYKEEEDFWKSSECHVLTDTPSLLILQFNDINFEKIKIYIYAKHVYQNSVTIYPVTADGEYVMDEQTLSSSEISENGIEKEIKDHFVTSKFTLIKK